MLYFDNNTGTTIFIVLSFVAEPCARVHIGHLSEKSGKQIMLFVYIAVVSGLFASTWLPLSLENWRTWPSQSREFKDVWRKVAEKSQSRGKVVHFVAFGNIRCFPGDCYYCCYVLGGGRENHIYGYPTLCVNKFGLFAAIF